ncbi:MAG: Holliday junction branch migration protein RuvA [Patescibacteria group bacterium]
MIIMLQGTIEYKGLNFVILVRDGIGYKVSLPDSAVHSLSGEVSLYTHEIIRDDAHELFGFQSMGALELFWKLISISGVGPRNAQRIIFSSDIDEVKSKIMSGDLTFLMNVPGIGKKTAQKIILELKGVLAEEPITSQYNKDALEALVGLGYQRRQAQDVLAVIEVEDTEECIRTALKMLSR